MNKAYSVGPYGEDWIAIVHTDTRAQARMKGSFIDPTEYIDMRAIRVPELDGKVITNQIMIDSGFPETWEGEPIDFVGYILDCGCELCKKALKATGTIT